MTRVQFMFELVAMVTITGLFLWGFASGPTHSWGWKAIVWLADYLQMRGA
jgi:hypothetical protein